MRADDNFGFPMIDSVFWQTEATGPIDLFIQYRAKRYGQQVKEGEMVTDSFVANDPLALTDDCKESDTGSVGFVS